MSKIIAVVRVPCVVRYTPVIVCMAPPRVLFDITSNILDRRKSFIVFVWLDVVGCAVVGDIRATKGMLGEVSFIQRHGSNCSKNALISTNCVHLALASFCLKYHASLYCARMNKCARYSDGLVC